MKEKEAAWPGGEGRVTRGFPGLRPVGGPLELPQRPLPRGLSAAVCEANNNDGNNSNYYLLLPFCVRDWAIHFLYIISLNPQSNTIKWIILSPFYSLGRLHNLPKFTARKN